MLHLVRLTVQFSLFLENIIFLFNFKEVDNVPSRPSAVFPWCLTPGSHWAGNFSWYKCKTGKFLHLFLTSLAAPALPPACHIELPSRREAGTVRQSDRHILSLSWRDTPSHSLQSRGSKVYFYLHSGKDKLGYGSLSNVNFNVDCC